jgi:hypothetical protein
VIYTRILSILLAAALWAVAPVRAADYDTGLGAYASGDYTAALKEWRPLAEQGNADAQFGLAEMYDQGRGVSVDHELAASWYQKAAEQGNARAQTKLGTMFATGQGVPVDLSTAVVWWTKAAEQGSPAAQMRLAEAYREGQGVSRDLTAAEVWYGRAAQAGVSEARVGLFEVGKEREREARAAADTGAVEVEASKAAAEEAGAQEGMAETEPAAGDAEGHEAEAATADDDVTEHGEGGEQEHASAAAAGHQAEPGSEASAHGPETEAVVEETASDDTHQEAGEAGDHGATDAHAVDEGGDEADHGVVATETEGHVDEAEVADAAVDDDKHAENDGATQELTEQIEQGSAVLLSLGTVSEPAVEERTHDDHAEDATQHEATEPEAEAAGEATVTEDQDHGAEAEVAGHAASEPGAASEDGHEVDQAEEYGADDGGHDEAAAEAAAEANGVSMESHEAAGSEVVAEATEPAAMSESEHADDAGHSADVGYEENLEAEHAAADAEGDRGDAAAALVGAEGVDVDGHESAEVAAVEAGSTVAVNEAAGEGEAPLVITPDPLAEVADATVAPADGVTADAAPVVDEGSDTAAGFRIWLASFHDEASARAAWQALSRANADVLGALMPTIVRVDDGGGGSLYRVQAGPFASAIEAQDVCAALGARSTACVAIVR